MTFTRPARVWRLVRTDHRMPEPGSVVARAQAFAASARELQAVVLLTVGDYDGVTGHVLTAADPRADKAALNLAQAVAAEAEPVQAIPDLTRTRTLGVLRVNRRAAPVRDTQQGADPTETARRVEMALRTFGARPDDPPTWVAAVVRRARDGERRRVLAWYSARLGAANPVHHAGDMDSVVISLLAGGAGRGEVRQRLAQVAAALPGFDVGVRVRFVTPWPAAAGALTVAALLGGTAVWAGRVAPAAARPDLPPAALAVAVLLAVAAACLAVLPLRRRAVRARARRCEFPVPRRGFGPRPRKFPAAGEPRHAAPRYPLPGTAFLVGPALLTGLVAPHAGAASGATTTGSRVAPPAVLDPGIGPLLGDAGEPAAPVHLSAADQHLGLVAVGRPGTGKSVLIRLAYAWNCLERVHPSGRPGRPGARNTLVAFESKGAEGAGVYREWALATGDRALLIEAADPATVAVDLFDTPGTVQDRARTFTAMLVYAFEPGAIQGRAVEALTAALSGALVTTGRIARDAHLPPARSPVFYAHVLLGGRGDERATALAAAIGRAADRADSSADPDSAENAYGPAELDEVLDRLQPFFGTGTTSAARRGLTESSRNKLDELLAAEHWWSPARRTVTWRQVLTGHRSVVINTGAAGNGRQLNERLTGYLSAMLTFSLREAISATCTGWREQGRSVSVFADELALLAGSSAEVLTWLHDAGRSYGVRPYLATQRISQLPPALAESILDYGTVCWFAQSNPDVADRAARDLSVDGSAWSPADVTNLPPYTAVVRTHVRERRQPAVPVRVAFFEDRMTAFAAAQGYPADPPAQASPVMAVDGR